jgi:broad specificity phosphatase PhoE
VAELWLMRHGATDWSRSGAHPGRTDLPLIRDGEMVAARIGGCFTASSSPWCLSVRGHARERPAGSPATAMSRRSNPICANGTTARTKGAPPLTSARSARTGLSGATVFRRAKRSNRWPARARRVERALQGEGDVALFAHGHILRMIAACWLNVPPSAGASLALTTASVSRLGYERENRVIALSNFAP